MQSDQLEATRKWYAQGRWALVLALIGVVIVCFVVATRGEYGAWMLWIAVPLLMISLGYFYIVNAIPVFLGAGEHHQSEREQEEEPREK
jgi:fatty-acid desaturase